MLYTTLAILLVIGNLVSLPPVGPQAITPLAVLDFDNHSGNPRYDPLGKGLAAMMISDLASVPSVQLVERSRLTALIEELDLQQSSYFDPATAQRLGRIVGAEYMLLGSIVALDPQIRLDTRIVQVSTGEIVKTAQVAGQENSLFDLQEKLARELIEGIEISLSPEEREALRARQEANRIEEWETMLAFSDALGYFDREDYMGGAERMALVVRDAPQSLLVRLFYDEARERAAAGMRDRARDAGGRFIRGLLQ
jgi:TolB-like protein